MHELEAKHAAVLKGVQAEQEKAVAEAVRTERAKKEAEQALREAEMAAMPELIHNLMVAHKLGNLDNNANCTAILTDISSCLKNGSARGRELSHASKTFYGLLLNNSSPWAHKFISGALFGPDLRTSQKARAAFDHGLVELGLTTESLKALKVHLERFQLHNVPGLVSEDATTALKRLDAELVEQLVSNGTPAEVWEVGVKLWGFAGETQMVKSADDLRELFKSQAIAGYVYVYVWIPLVKGAPWFPFAMVATDNKFDNKWVFDRWRIIHKGCEMYSLPLAGHISDGDARLRKNDYRVNNATNATVQSWYGSHYFLKHSLLMLSVPTTIEGLSIFGHQDYMHLAWRVRVQLLSPKKEWEIGPGQRVGVAPLDSLFKGGKKLLNGRDLDPHNKQHWAGVLKMFSCEVSLVLMPMLPMPVPCTFSHA